MCIRDRGSFYHLAFRSIWFWAIDFTNPMLTIILTINDGSCLLYTSDAADDLLCVDLGGRRVIKKKT